MAKEKNLTAITSVAAEDSLRVVTSAGASVKAALSNFPTSGTNTSVTAGSTVEDTLHNYIDSLPNAAQMYTKSLNASGYGTRMVIIQKYTNGNYASALEWGYLDTQPIKYHRKVNGTWVVDTLPTRAEVDALYTPTVHTMTFGDKSWQFRKLGKLVVVNAYGDIKSASAGINTVGTLPTEYRPAYQVYLGIENDTAKRSLSISTAGVVNFYTPTAISTATNCGIGGCYITN